MAANKEPKLRSDFLIWKVLNVDPAREWLASRVHRIIIRVAHAGLRVVRTRMPGNERAVRRGRGAAIPLVRLAIVAAAGGRCAAEAQEGRTGGRRHSGCVYVTGHLRTYLRTQASYNAMRTFMHGNCTCVDTADSFEHRNMAHGIYYPCAVKAAAGRCAEKRIRPEAVRRAAIAAYRPSVLHVANSSASSSDGVPVRLTGRRYHGTDVETIAASAAAVRRVHAACAASEPLARSGLILKTRPDVVVSAPAVLRALDAASDWLSAAGGSRRVLVGCHTGPGHPVPEWAPRSRAAARREHARESAFVRAAQARAASRTPSTSPPPTRSIYSRATTSSLASMASLTARGDFTGRISTAASSRGCASNAST